MVIGTTGLSPDQARSIEEAARKAPIMWAANMSLGVNILQALVEANAGDTAPYGGDATTDEGRVPGDRRVDDAEVVPDRHEPAAG